jgi:hypothetical protein
MRTIALIVSVFEPGTARADLSPPRSPRGRIEGISKGVIGSSPFAGTVPRIRLPPRRAIRIDTSSAADDERPAQQRGRANRRSSGEIGGPAPLGRAGPPGAPCRPACERGVGIKGPIERVASMKAREDKRARNQELFRRANERLDERVRDLDVEPSFIPFICECADDRCLGRVHLTDEVYEDVRAKPNRYVIVPGHATVEGEKVVEDNGHFHVVEKEQDGSE